MVTWIMVQLFDNYSAIKTAITKRRKQTVKEKLIKVKNIELCICYAMDIYKSKCEYTK